MRVGIIRYPGSNCDQDTLRFFKNSFYIWHTEEKLPVLDLLVIPGGFAFGDRVYEKATDKYIISPGEKALSSPVTKVILEAASRGIPILGICNGFQILIHLGLLPGSLVKNNNEKFHSKFVTCHAVCDFFSDCTITGKNIDLPIANGYGNYQIEYDAYKELVVNKQIFLHYNNHDNGSVMKIAGVRSKNKKIYGMMPHFERVIGENVFANLFIDSELSKNIDMIMNSEHVSYKSTISYLKNLYTEGEHVIQGPGENAGIISLNDEYCLALRIESHNHPTFINPYEGAKTGVGGILRDIFTMGARPIALLDFLRFGVDENSNILAGSTINGISDYGNCVGVPVVGGDFYRDSTYNLNPLVNIACLGLIKKENIIYGHALRPGLVLIYIGAKTGREGVGGAEMASNSFSSDVSIESLKKKRSNR